MIAGTGAPSRPGDPRGCLQPRPILRQAPLPHRATPPSPGGRHFPAFPRSAKARPCCYHPQAAQNPAEPRLRVPYAKPLHGAHDWARAARILGIELDGVGLDVNGNAVATANAAGHRCVQGDIRSFDTAPWHLAPRPRVPGGLPLRAPRLPAPVPPPPDPAHLHGRGPGAQRPNAGLSVGARARRSTRVSGPSARAGRRPGTPLRSDRGRARGRARAA